jgi:hypothetical protein
MKERIDIAAKLEAMVAHLYGLSKSEFQYIVTTFDSIEEDSNLVRMQEIGWNDDLIRKFNGEVRKRAVIYHDAVSVDFGNKTK